MTIRILGAVLLMFTFVAIASTGSSGCQQSTRVDVEDDEEGPAGSGPYAADVKEVTREIIQNLKDKKIARNFRARWDDAPIVALIRPQNDTRFPEVTDFFQEDMLTALMDEFTREEFRFSQRASDVQDAVAAEKEAKEAGDRTDRTGRRTKLGADYFLRAKFTQLSRTDGREEDDTIKYSYELIDTETDELIFKGSHDIRRVSTSKVIYR